MSYTETIQKQQLELQEKYPIGSWLWQQCNKTRDCWRTGIVKAHSLSNWSTLTCSYPPPSQRTFTVYGYYNWMIMQRKCFWNVPDGTTYLNNTQIGDSISRRIKGLQLEVFECATNMVRTGLLKGYVVIPCIFTDCKIYYKRPSFKTWVIPPNVRELLSFLSVKMDEIYYVHSQIKKEEDGNEETAAVDSTVTAG